MKKSLFVLSLFLISFVFSYPVFATVSDGKLPIVGSGEVTCFFDRITVPPDYSKNLLDLNTGYFGRALFQVVAKSDSLFNSYPTNGIDSDTRGVFNYAPSPQGSGRYSFEVSYRDATHPSTVYTYMSDVNGNRIFIQPCTGTIPISNQTPTTPATPFNPTCTAVSSVGAFPGENLSFTLNLDGGTLTNLDGGASTADNKTLTFKIDNSKKEYTTSGSMSFDRKITVTKSNQSKDIACHSVIKRPFEISSCTINATKDGWNATITDSRPASNKTPIKMVSQVFKLSNNFLVNRVSVPVSTNSTISVVFPRLQDDIGTFKTKMTGHADITEFTAEASCPDITIQAPEAFTKTLEVTSSPQETVTQNGVDIGVHYPGEVVNLKLTVSGGVPLTNGCTPAGSCYSMNKVFGKTFPFADADTKILVSGGSAIFTKAFKIPAEKVIFPNGGISLIKDYPVSVMISDNSGRADEVSLVLKIKKHSEGNFAATCDFLSPISHNTIKVKDGVGWKAVVTTPRTNQMQYRWKYPLKKDGAEGAVATETFTKPSKAGDDYTNSVTLTDTVTGESTIATCPLIKVELIVANDFSCYWNIDGVSTEQSKNRRTYVKSGAIVSPYINFFSKSDRKDYILTIPKDQTKYSLDDARFVAPNASLEVFLPSAITLKSKSTQNEYVIPCAGGEVATISDREKFGVDTDIATQASISLTQTEKERIKDMEAKATMMLAVLDKNSDKLFNDTQAKYEDIVKNLSAAEKLSIDVSNIELYNFVLPDGYVLQNNLTDMQKIIDLYERVQDALPTLADPRDVCEKAANTLTDAVNLKTGWCRYRAPFLALALRRNGFNAEAISANSLVSVGGHVWVRVYDVKLPDGTKATFDLDPTWYGKNSSSGLPFVPLKPRTPVKK